MIKGHLEGPSLALMAATAFVLILPVLPASLLHAEPQIAFYPSETIAAYANGAFKQWEKLATAHTISPVAGSAGDLTYEWVAPDHRSVRTVVRLPRAGGHGPDVTMSQAEPGQDARPLFEAAMARARSARAVRLNIPKGRYVFSSLSADASSHLAIENLDDITIDGHGSTLVFTQDETGILVRACNRVKLTHFTIEYAFPTVSIGTILSKGAKKFLVLDSAFPVGPREKVYYLSEFDAATKNWVPGGQRVIIPPGSSTAPLYIGNQTYSSAAFRPLVAGKTFAVFHHFYGGVALRIGDSPGPGQPEDIVIDDVTINSGPGMGILAYGIKRGFAVINSTIAPTASSASGVSTEYDAIHILELGGDLIIAHNVISGQGDDAINLNNPISRISAIDQAGRSIVLAPYSRFISAGDDLAFFDDAGRFSGETKVLSTKSLGGLKYEVNLNSMPADLNTNYVVRDVNLIDSRFVIADNKIERCNCHGILVQLPNGLVDHNEITNTKANAIRLLSSTGVFKEGVGALNVKVSNNSISDSGSDSAIAMPWAAVTAYAPIAGNRLSPFPVNADIQIVGNTISRAQESCITVSSSIRVVVANNHCDKTNLARPGTGSIHVFASEDVDLQANSRSGPTSGSLDIDWNSVHGGTAQNGY